ncbi:MAG: lysine--tRNA ligase [Candidatus Aminicenantes bacterium]|nr:lysine--tRNA ligase [Candidatus Aminicenantes bacterium]
MGKKPEPKAERKPTDQEDVRASKLEELRKAGVDVFPSRVSRTHSVHEAATLFAGWSKEELEEKNVRVEIPGRILSVRRMGRATFFHLSDGRTRLQAYLREDVVGPELYERFFLTDIGDILSVKGTLFKTKTGELTVKAETVAFLAKCLHPLPEKWHGLQDVELRFRKRYLDLIMNPEVGEVFRLRSALVSAIRRFFDERGFLEVETPMMHPIPGGALARPFKTFHNALGLELYLRIAPELYLKRLVVGGLERVYEINRNFRNEGLSSEHNPEFTMLEFYQAYADHHDMMDLTEELITRLARELLGAEDIRYGGEALSLKRPWARVKFLEAVAAHSGLEPALLKDPKAVVRRAEELAPEKKAVTYGKALDVLFDKFVKPKLIQPTFVLNHPREISPLAKGSPGKPEEAERFELVMAGMEIANAFSELTDPREQRLRFEQQAGDRERGDEETHVLDLDYVTALEYGLPPTGGEGVGIDRLAMLFADRPSIREVILFPLLRPKA